MASSQKPADYSSWTHADLLARVSELERQLRVQNAELAARSTITAGASKLRQQRRPRRANAFDASKYATRHIALKLAYLGQRYNGFEHSNGNATRLPTIEEMLWKALRKARLISPPSEEPIEVAWSYAERSRKAVEITWEGCQYSKCGRTDKGVSAFGQVVGIRVRSNRPVERPENPSSYSDSVVVDDVAADDFIVSSELPTIGVDEGDETYGVKSSFDPIKDELPYISILNSVLPSDIRVLAWCPHPPDDFDARFSCGERRYKYFFTNPAFLPTAGPLGLKTANGKSNDLREGWLDVDAMREGAKKLVGLHDFRNFCKVDTSKQLTTFERRITYVNIEEIPQASGPTAFTDQYHLAKEGRSEVSVRRIDDMQVTGPRVYTFTVHGSAFLWHQVRHMVAVLFLIGQKLELPSIIDELLDIEKNRCRPTYEMASDAPLVLWDCIFPKDKVRGGDDELDWIYAGDERSLGGLNTKGDGKFGLGGVVDEIWSNWRRYKIDETLSATLLDLVIGQGDGSALERAGFRDLDVITYRSQKLFDGSETARMAGRYIPVMEKPQMDTVDVQNAKYRDGKGSRREFLRAQELNRDDED